MRMSLPAGERGSKCREARDPEPHPESLPAGERGSKYDYDVQIKSSLSRSPQGSVDRNSEVRDLNELVDVAPRRGAWIEMQNGVEWPDVEQSLPAGERGSKFVKFFGRVANKMVAPRRGAWIEIQSVTSARLLTLSLPAGERGSKYPVES